MSWYSLVPRCKRCRSEVWDGCCQADCKDKSPDEVLNLRRFNGGLMDYYPPQGKDEG